MRQGVGDRKQGVAYTFYIQSDHHHHHQHVYAPNNDSQSAKFYEHIVNVLKKEYQKYEDRIIFGGDFNCPLNPSLDKMGGLLTTRKKIVDQIENIQNVFNVHDVWRIKHPNQKSFTWSQKSPFIFCRLDYWLFLSDQIPT